MSDETRLVHKMAWVLLTTIIVWPFITIVTTIIVFCLTKNPLSLSLFPTLTTPVVAYLIALLKPLLPMNEKRYHLAEKKLDVNKRDQGTS
jgi:hypothetical protein